MPRHFTFPRGAEIRAKDRNYDSLIRKLTFDSDGDILLPNLTSLSIDLGTQSAPLSIDFADLEKMVRSRRRQDVTEATRCGSNNRSGQVARMEAIAVRVKISGSAQLIWHGFDRFRALSAEGIKVELDISEYND